MQLGNGHRVTPSRHHPFEGFVPGGLTKAQQVKASAMREKIERNRRQQDLPQTYTVRIQYEPQHLNEPVRFALILCPVIAARKDRTRILVIAPDGSDQWVDWK